MRVLLIEDSSADADLIIQHLRSERHTITFERVDSALGVRAALKNKSWDVVLCDDSMPGFDSRGALSIVKLSGVDVPFIIVSGTMSEQTASDVMRAGARDFLLKDNLTRLLPAIEREMRDTAGRIERKRMQEERLLLDRLVSIGTLAAGVAHEINNPLAYVLANIDFALDKLPGGGERAEPAMDRNEVILALQQAREGSERIRIIARDLKVFCHSDQGDPTSVDVRVVLESAITMAWNEIRHRARLVKVFADVPPVDANENRLAQVFLNLLVNAAQAITEGDAAGNEIRVTTWHELAEVVVEISDTGPGVAPEAQDHLFQPFFTTKPAGMGTGLGLSICQGIIKDLGGTIGVRSETGSGTTVRVSLPKGKLKQTVKSSLPPSSPTKGRRGRILVVDDELSLVQTLQRILEVDHDVRGSSDARAALQMLSSEQNFDVILCDLMMPQMTGMQFHAELVRTSPVMAERVVFLTAGAFTSRAKQFLDSVPNRRLEKPFDARALRATIQKIIARIDIPSR
jgi:signal transduction histidine kinase/ActR/RegA family two-component response regulator